MRLGIDFGTANTVAVIELPGREPRPLLFEGSPLLPSAVCLDTTGRLLVGRDAEHTGLAEPASLEPHPKRCIDDTAVLLGDTEVPVTALIGAVIARVADEAGRVAGGPPAEVVLTCPASWGAHRRQTLLDAAASVLPAVRLVTEPAAAATYFVAVGADLVPVDRPVLVYDFGAGTFDASVVRCGAAGGFAVLAAEGLPDCGGLDIDAAIVDHLAATLAGQDPAAWDRLAHPATVADRRASRQLWDGVRAAKEMLSRTTTTLVHVPLFDSEVLLGREQLYRLAAGVHERTADAGLAALRAARVRPGDLAAVFLAGGTSRMPAVATLLHRTLGIAPTIVDHPELSVAEGGVRSAPAGGPPESPSAWPPGSTEPWVPVAGAADAFGTPGVAGVPGGRRGGRLAVAVGCRGVRVAAAVVLVLALIAGVAVWLAGRSDGSGAAGPGHSRGPASPSPSASQSPTRTAPPGLDLCLFGTWRRTSSTKNNPIFGQTVAFTGGAGQLETYREDGTVSVDFGAGAPRLATVNGSRWEEVLTGTASARYRATGGVLTFSTPVVDGTWTLNQNGRRNNSGKLSLSLEPEQYACTGDAFSVTASTFTAEYARVV
jgi:hypothetical protein